MKKGQRVLSKLIPAGMDGRVATVVLLALFFVSLLFPYTGDDWAWGSSIGLDRLAVWFADYNGRYVGNLLVIALTRNVILRSVVVAATMYGIALCVDRIDKARGPLAFWLSLLLLFCMPVTVRAQGIVWTSGFTNYAVPALFILMYFALFRDAFFDGYVPNASRVVPCLILGFVNALIMENVTLFNVGISAVMLVYTRVRHKRWDLTQAAFLLGSVAGCVIMFTNGAYSNVAAGEDGYRSVADRSLKGIAKKTLFSIVPLLVLNNWAVNACWAVAGVATAIRQRTKASVVAAIPLVLMGCISMRSIALPYTFKSGATSGIVVVACGLLAIAAFVGMLYVATKYAGRLGQAIVLSVVALSLPLVLVNPIGPRCFFPTYCLFVVSVCLVTKGAFEGESYPSIGWVLPLAALMLWTSWIVVFGEACIADYTRVSAAKEQIAQGATTVEVKKLPNSNQLHVPNPSEEPWNTRFKMFYGIDKDIVVVCK